MSVDTPYRAEDPTIVNLRDCRRGFHFRAMFHIANVMPWQTAVLFHVWLLNFSLVFLVVLATQLKSGCVGSSQANKPFHATVSCL